MPANGGLELSELAAAQSLAHPPRGVAPCEISAKFPNRICDRYFPNLSKPQARTLAAFRFGAATAQSRALNAAARALPFLGIPDAVESKLRVFIPDSRIDAAKRFENLSWLVIRNLPMKDPVIVFVDEASLRDKLKAMVVAVAYVGRAVPVAERL